MMPTMEASVTIGHVTTQYHHLKRVYTVHVPYYSDTRHTLTGVIPTPTSPYSMSASPLSLSSLSPFSGFCCTITLNWPRMFINMLINNNLSLFLLLLYSNFLLDKDTCINTSPTATQCFKQGTRKLTLDLYRWM